MIDFTKKGALFSDDRKNRYMLWRKWKPIGDKNLCCFIMLNPSLGDENRLDPTLTRCMNFAYQWGYTGCYIGNIFPVISPDSSALYDSDYCMGHDSVLSKNDLYLLSMVGMSQITVLAWGNHGKHLDRGRNVYKLITDRGYLPRLHVLAVNKAGHPGHPLYLHSGLIPQPVESIKKGLFVWDR
jgi:hypothetical protein